MNFDGSPVATAAAGKHLDRLKWKSLHALQVYVCLVPTTYIESGVDLSGGKLYYKAIKHYGTTFIIK